jgi:hypothetical protein
MPLLYASYKKRTSSTSRSVAGSNPDGVVDIPSTDSASNRNENQEYFLVGNKGGRCMGLTNLSPSYADYLDIWSLSLLEFYGLVICMNRNYCTFTFSLK